MIRCAPLREPRALVVRVFLRALVARPRAAALRERVLVVLFLLLLLEAVRLLRVLLLFPRAAVFVRPLLVLLREVVLLPRPLVVRFADADFPRDLLRGDELFLVEVVGINVDSCVP